MIKINNLKNRKGISTVVGSVFFIIVFTTAAGYVVYSMNQLDKFGETIISKSQDLRNTQQEEFKITSVTKDNNKFNITIQNTGQIPINVTRLWIQNRTDPTWPISKYTVNQMVSPGESLSKIGQNLPVTALATQAYDLTVATERGNNDEVLVNSASVKPIYMQLYVLPDTIQPKYTTTLLFAVTNNMSSNTALTNLSPNPPQITSYGATAALVSGPEPLQYKFLDSGDTAYFKWVYNITGTTGQKVQFQTSLQNGYLGNTVSKNVTVNAIVTSQPTHFLVGQWDTERSFTDIGTSFVDVYATPNSNGHALQIDTNKFSQYQYQIIWTKVGSGTQTCQLVDAANGANIIAITASLSNGINTGSDTAIPAGLLNSIKNYKWQCKSTVSSDDPTFLAARIWLKP
ncbi:MAG: hypothetical protein ABI340_09850 [Nitrososphaera sp.]|jgi:hypothetical protein